MYRHQRKVGEGLRSRRGDRLRWNSFKVADKTTSER